MSAISRAVLNLKNTLHSLRKPALSQLFVCAVLGLYCSLAQAVVPDEQIITNGVSVRLFQRAIDKAIKEIPTLVGPVISRYGIEYVFQKGETDVLGCTLGYELGVRDVEFEVDLRPPTSMSLVFEPNQTMKLNFDIRGSGSAYPYAQGNFCGWEPDAGPTVSAGNLYGRMTLIAAVVDGQIRVYKADLNLGLGFLHVDLGPISWLLDEVLGLHDEFDDWVRDLVLGFANEMASDMLPGIIETALRDRLRFDTTAEGFDLAVALSSMNTTYGSLTLQASTGLYPTVPVACPAGGNCMSPEYTPGFGTPNDHPVADAAVAVTLPSMNQALFAAFRSGKLAYEQDLDAAEVLGALVPGLPVQGLAHVDVKTLVAPRVEFAEEGSTDPRAIIDGVEVHITVDPSSTIGAIDMTIRTNLGARAIIELTPPFLGEDPNPVGNQVRLRMTDFVLGETTLVSGPQSGLLTEQERQTIMELLVLPMYESRVGILPITSTIMDYKVPGTNRRAALRVLEKQRVSDAVAVYVEFAISPVNDTEQPVARITKVAGKVPNFFTREVLIPATEAIVQWTGSDDFEEYEPYMTFDTSLDGGSWTERNYLRTIRLSGLDEGVNWFYVRARDFANNFSVNPTTPAGQSGAVRIVVDTLPPSTQLETAPNPYINSTSALLGFVGVDSGSGIKDYVLQVDGQARPIITASPARTLLGLSEGPHSVVIKARDRVDNIDPVGAVATFTVDLTPPSTRLSPPRTGFVKPSAARFSIGSSDNLSPLNLMEYGYQVNGPSCGNGAFTPFSFYGTADLTTCTMADGVYQLQARAKDAAGNIDSVGAATSFTVDGTVPQLRLLEKPAARTTDKQLEFLAAASDNFSSPTEISYSYRLVGLTDDYSVPTNDPHLVLEHVPSGDYILQLRASDLADNFSELVEFPFALDNGAPTTSLDQPLPEWITESEIPVIVSASDDRSAPDALRYAVTIDGSTTIMTAPVVLRDVPEGLHTMQIAALDEFDNRDADGVSTNFTVDRTGPETTLARRLNQIAPGQLRPSVGGSDNLTAEGDLRFSYRVTRPGTPTTMWSTPKSKDEFVIALRELGPITLEIAAVDNAGLFDATPLVIKSHVAPVTGCSSTGASSDELAGTLAMVALLMVRLRRARRAN